MRHGERVDEVSGSVRSAWACSTAVQEGRYYDPPLTKHGHVQASAAGLHLRILQSNHQAGTTAGGGEGGCSPSFDTVYTSPLVRAVQTAACVSRALGGLPLQVVPGLCACTAGLRRTGFEQSVLMTDADIVDAFPEVKLIPRDPSAPTSFRGAQDWLATRPYRRVLAVGHREGTKAMAGRNVPTPHCCIGIFKIDAMKSFELYDLLSHKGESLGADPPSPYARQTKIRKEIQLAEGPQDSENGPENRGLKDLYSRMLALDLRPGRPSGARKARVIRSSSDTAAEKGPSPQACGIGQVQRSTTAVAGGGCGTASGLPDTVHAIWSGGQRWAGRKLVGPASSSSARRERSNAKPKPASGAKARGPSVTVRGSSRRSSSASVDGKKAVKGLTTAPSAKAAAPGTQSGQYSPGANAGNGGGALPPSVARCRPHDTHDAADDSASGGRAKGHAVSKGKPAARACAGPGFRVAALTRRSAIIEKSRYGGVMGVPVDVLSGPSGVLCFLRPTELCTVRRMAFLFVL